MLVVYIFFKLTRLLLTCFSSSLEMHGLWFVVLTWGLLKDYSKNIQWVSCMPHSHSAPSWFPATDLCYTPPHSCLLNAKRGKWQHFFISVFTTLFYLLLFRVAREIDSECYMWWYFIFVLLALLNIQKNNGLFLIVLYVQPKSQLNLLIWAIHPWHCSYSMKTQKCPQQMHYILYTFHLQFRKLFSFLLLYVGNQYLKIYFLSSNSWAGSWDQERMNRFINTLMGVFFLYGINLEDPDWISQKVLRNWLVATKKKRVMSAFFIIIFQCCQDLQGSIHINRALAKIEIAVTETMGK